MPAKVVPQRVQLEIKRAGAFRFAVVADTHSKPHPATAARLRELAPDAILHAGDIGDLAVLDELRQVAPLIAVRGNIDEKVRDLPDQVLVELMNGPTLKLRLLLVHIAVYGGIKLRAEIASTARKERASLVVCGHSHVPFIGSDKGIGVFNPGSIGPKRFQLPIVLGVLDIEGDRASLRHIDCATGQVWAP